MPEVPEPLPSGEGINPYQPPEGAAPRVATGRVADRARADRPGSPLRFWEGRRALLQSLFYMRCYAVVAALMTLRGGYLLVQVYFGPEQGLLLSDEQATMVLWMAARFAIAVLTMVLTLGFSYVIWQYSRALQQVAGRHETDPTEVCRQHLLCWRIAVAMLAVMLLQQGVGYLHDRAIAAELSAMADDLGTAD